MQGWIKLHRNWLESKTIQLLNAEQQAITLQIILRANYKDGKWFDANRSLEVEVKRGQLITSRNKIANEWFLGDKSITEQKVRTTLKKLEKLNFLTITTTKTYTLITIEKYGVWQDEEEISNQDINQEPTKEQPSSNQESTTNKNVKNAKNEKEVISSSRKFKIYDSESDYFQLALRLYKQIKNNNQSFKEPNLQKWSDDIRLMMERDQRTYKQIEYLINWCQQDSFWKSNILSPKKLRKQFDQLVIKATSEHQKKKDTQPTKLLSLERPQHLQEPVLPEDIENEIQKKLEDLPY